MPSEFVVPGQNRRAAALDVARTVVRRAERLSPSVDDLDTGSLVGPYLNRLSDLVWAHGPLAGGRRAPRRPPSREPPGRADRLGGSGAGGPDGPGAPGDGEPGAGR